MRRQELESAHSGLEHHHEYPSSAVARAGWIPATDRFNAGDKRDERPFEEKLPFAFVD